MLKTIHMALTILLVLAAGGILASHGQNDRWAYIISGKNGTRVYLEKTYRELDNSNRLIWAKYERTDGTSSMSLFEFACKSERYRITQYFEYDRIGTVTDSYSHPDSAWDELPPESIAEALYQEVCAWQKRVLPEYKPRLSEQRTPPESKETRPESTDLGVDYAVVTATNANLREDANMASTSLLSIPKGDVLVLLDRNPVGLWYNVVHVKTNQEGWVHSSTVSVSYTQKPKPLITIPRSRTGSYGDPYVSVTNDTEKTMTLRIGEKRYVFSPHQEQTIYLSPGKYKFHASAPNVIPDFGEDLFEPGYHYTWRFYIVVN